MEAYKFLCDKMLGGLGRWLRAAGYDTEIIETDMEDQKILQYALLNKRILLTRDRHFLEMQAPKESIVYCQGNGNDICIKELNSKLQINWLHNPFSRCLVCNTKLTETKEQAILDQIPEDVRNTTKKFWYCSRCQKAYWNGSHTTRMLEQLKKWQND